MTSDPFAAADRPVRIGVQIAPQHAEYSLIRETLRRVEGMGADIAFNWDHFFPLSGEPDGLHFEAWTELAAWAEQTEKIEIGPLVNCNSYRNPNLQADMARTIDHISGGRFIFGTGSGWFERDYDEYGYEFGTVGGRLNALAEDLPIVRDRWTKLNPAPVRDIPILIGGGGEKKTLRIVAEHADIWHSFSDEETLRRKLDILRGHADDVGRDVSGIELSTEIRTRSIEEADAQYELGVRLFTVGITAPDYDFTAVKKWIDWRDSKN
ncbi:MAG: LLM class F420-dependent oxidoreductase [Naasia sp.]